MSSAAVLTTAMQSNDGGDLFASWCNKRFRLTYFNGQGRAELIRLIFVYAQVPFEDVRISFNDWPKLEQTLPLAHLPTLEIEDVRTGEKSMLFQSATIARYLANLFGLAGETLLEKIEVDEALECVRDILDVGADALAEKDVDKKARLIEYLRNDLAPRTFHFLEQRAIENDGKLTSCKGYTVSDLAVVSLLGIVRKGLLIDTSDLDIMTELSYETYVPALDDNHPYLNELEVKILQLPQIKRYMDNRPETPF